MASRTKTRIRVTGPLLRTWEEVDDRLRQIGLLDLQVEEIEADLQVRIAELKQAAAERAKPLQAQREEYVHQVSEFVERHRDELEPGKKSRALNFGTVGFRQSTRIRIQRIAETLARLKEKVMFDCIRVREEPDKERLREYPDEVLQAVGVTRVVEDAFFVEIDRARVKSVGDVSLG